MTRVVEHRIDKVTWQLAGGAAVIKGLVISGVLALLDIAFWQQIVIASISAVLSGMFVIVAAIITVHQTYKNRVEIEHVKRAIGIDRRADDEHPEKEEGS